THEQSVSRLYEDDPAAIRRDLRKAVAHAVFGCPGDSLRRAALSAVEGNAIEVVLDLRFSRIVCVVRLCTVFGIRGTCRRPDEYDVFPIGAPHSARLDKALVVGSRYGL